MEAKKKATNEYRWFGQWPIVPPFETKTYRLYVWWVSNRQYSSQVEYDVSTSNPGSPGYTVFKDQRSGGGQWQLLGEHSADIAGFIVNINAAYGKTSADAIRYVEVPDPVTTTGERTAFIHTDHLGTPRAVTDDTQTVIWKWDSRPFGDSSPYEDPDGDANEFTLNLRFPGKYYDVESGLHYNYFRDYDPGTGRYVESDPIGLRGGVNTYSYSYSNPITYIDIFGLCSLKPDVKKCLEDIFGETVEDIQIETRVIGDELITTRPNKIYLPKGFSCEEFQNRSDLLLHEFFHVLRQWNTGELSRFKYIIEVAKNGTGNDNKYERAANDFARENIASFKECLTCDTQ